MAPKQMDYDDKNDSMMLAVTEISVDVKNDEIIKLLGELIAEQKNTNRYLRAMVDV